MFHTKRIRNKWNVPAAFAAGVVFCLLIFLLVKVMPQFNRNEETLIVLTARSETIYQGENLELTKNEFRILKLLMENHGNVVSRETIMEKLWESDSFIDDNTLTVNVTRLRRKLETIGMKEFIQTKKGVGYLV